MTEGHDIAMGLRRAYLSMHRQADAALSRFSLTASQFVLLALLDERDGVSQRDLVERASSDPNTIRPMLTSLEKKGLVVRKPNPSDRRAWIVGITAKGKRTFEEAHKETEGFRELLLSNLDEFERDLFLQLLDKVAAAMSESAVQLNGELSVQSQNSLLSGPS